MNNSVWHKFSGLLVFLYMIFFPFWLKKMGVNFLQNKELFYGFTILGF